jgi:recombination protein RecA
METLLRAGLHDVIVLDSVSALIPQYEIDNDMNAGSMGAEQAKMMSKALRKLTVANKKTVVVFINQTREMLNVTFGKKTTTSGGRALPHYAGVRIEIVRTEQIKKKGQVVIDHKTARDTKGDVVLGFRALLRVEKDKTGGSQPSTETTFVFDYETGNIDPVEDLIYVGRLAGLVKKSGQDASEKWWVVDYEDEVQKGRPRFKKWLARNTAVAEELEEKIRAQIGATATALDDDNEDEQE